ncbi:hypothetical protein GCM10009639_67570 [Kitasatospora putterlickiae]|uniref:Uncharacterized protein n=1 Tax=Kitasatospora putterlickiae TaxID=221725 RepID=A0ABN1YHM3_9ACTN
MTNHTNAAPDPSTAPAPLMSMHTALVLLAAAFIGLVAGALTFLGGGPVAAAVLAGLTGAGASVSVLHKLIG